MPIPFTQAFDDSAPKDRKPVGIWLAAFATGGKSFEPSTAIAIYDCAAQAFGIDKTRSVHGGYGMHDDSPIREDRREWYRTHSQSMYAASGTSLGTRLSIGGRFRNEYIWHLGSFVDSIFISRDFTNQADDVPYLTFGISLDNALGQEAAKGFCFDACQALLKDDRVAYGLIDIVENWHISGMAEYFGKPAYGSWEKLLDRHMWMEFLCHTRQHARGVFWGNIFGREMADRLRAAGLHEMLAFNRDFHPQWDAIVIDGEHGGQAILLDDDPVLFAQKRGGRLICHAGVVQNGIVLRAAMMKAGLM